MTSTRLWAAGPPLAFAVLAGVLTAIGALDPGEAGWASASVALGFLLAGWFVPAGWRRRVAEFALLPAGYALALTGDPTMRRMLIPVLLVVASALACWASVSRTSRQTHPILLAAFGAAIALAPGPSPAGIGSTLLAGAACAAAGWGATRLGGAAVGTVSVFLASSGFLLAHSLLALAILVAGLAVGWLPRTSVAADRVARRWLPAAAALGLVASALAPWGGLPLHRAFPEAAWPALLVFGCAAVATPLLPPAVAGAAWVASTLALGPLAPPPPDLPGSTLTLANPREALPRSNGGPYLLDLSLGNAAGLPQGAPVATASAGVHRFVLRAGVDAAEWAWQRPDVHGRIAHAAPLHPVWRPAGTGERAFWGIAGRALVTLPAGITPRLERDPSLPPGVEVIVAAAGPARPTPPRNWPLPTWLLGVAAAVALIQLAAGTWRSGVAIVPWVVLLTGSLVARIPVEPLRLLGERHAVDLALAAFLAAWWPAARVWLRRGRIFLAGVALLLPLALATPHLTPPLWGDEPYHLVMLDSLTRFHTLDLSAHYPPAKPGSPVHSPVLALLLLPSYLIGGRSGALACLALAGAATVAWTTRRARRLGFSVRAVALMTVLVLTTYPLATFATQIWVEIAGAMLLAASLLLVEGSGGGRATVAAMTALAAAIKTRLGLAMFPLAVAAWWRKRSRGRKLVVAMAVLAGVAVAGLGATWALLGRPLGNRTLADLIPANPGLPLVVIGGLLFDPAGGLLFSAPLALLALGGTMRLWRRGGQGEKAMLLGSAATLLALLHSTEWYGGGSPPARYLVPLLPVIALAGVAVLGAPLRWRRLGIVLLPPTILTWWVLVSRPHLSINSGDGGWWFADALASRFGADGRHLFPSFLRPCPATIFVPAGVLALALLIALATRRRAATVRLLARQVATVWLLGLAGVVTVVTQRYDAVVEIEDPQVLHRGGATEPPEGTFARYTHPNGWRIADGEGIRVPMHLPAGARVRLEGWLEGPAQGGSLLRVGWDGGPLRDLPIAAKGRGAVLLPAPANATTRHQLDVVLGAPSGGSAVLDRLVVVR